MLDPATLDFTKGDGLLPVIVQDERTAQVLMLGYMNAAALARTQTERRITFYSRSKKRLWTKGESSGNHLELIDLRVDCDRDTLLALVRPLGPVCHTGSDTCFGTANQSTHFLQRLERVIQERKGADPATSYTSSLFAEGINKVAQKVGEEAVELIIEAKDDDRALFLGEAADLLYHYLVLLAAKDLELSDVVDVLRERHR